MGQKINVDYTNALQQVKKLQTASEKCTQTAADIKMQIGELTTQWKGDSASAAALKMEEYVRYNNELGKSIAEVAARLKKAVETIKYVDDNAFTSETRRRV